MDQQFAIRRQNNRTYTITASSASLASSASSSSSSSSYRTPIDPLALNFIMFLEGLPMLRYD